MSHLSEIAIKRRLESDDAATRIVVEPLGSRAIQPASLDVRLGAKLLEAEESPARSKKEPYAPNSYFSTKSRTIWDWLPIHDWSEGEVWDDIEASGIPHHFAYDLRMPRLSCAFCIYAPRKALVLAGKHNPELLSHINTPI